MNTCLGAVRHTWVEKSEKSITWSLRSRTVHRGRMLSEQYKLKNAGFNHGVSSFTVSQGSRLTFRSTNVRLINETVHASTR